MQELLSLLPTAPRFQRIRQRYYGRALRQCGENLQMLQHAILRFPGQISVGDNVFINRGAVITARDRISIGSNTLIGHYAVIISGQHGYRDRGTLINQQGRESAPIVIEEDVWVGAHAVILKGVVLGRGCVVAAGSVVTRSVEPYTVVAGTPARQIAERTELVLV